MKCSLDICNILEAMSVLCHSIVFVYCFALTAEEGFLISPCCSLGNWIAKDQQGDYLSFSPMPLVSLLF